MLCLENYRFEQDMVHKEKIPIKNIVLAKYYCSIDSPVKFFVTIKYIVLHDNIYRSKYKISYPVYYLFSTSFYYKIYKKNLWKYIASTIIFNGIFLYVCLCSY